MTAGTHAGPVAGTSSGPTTETRAPATRPVTPASILAARLADLHERAAATPGTDPTIVADLAAAHELAAGLDPYLDEHTSPESPALAELARRTAAHDWGAGDAGVETEMLSGHVEGRFLAMLVAATGARRVLEVGLFTGYSALAMAEALPADGEVVACELDAGVAAFARDALALSPAGSRVDVRVGPAADTLDALADAGERFDLVFVDADKAGYPGYLTTVLGPDNGRDDTPGGLLAAGGLVVVDNTLMQGEPWSSGPVSGNGDAIGRFNRAVTDDPRLEQVVVPLRDGVTLIRRADRR